MRTRKTINEEKRKGASMKAENPSRTGRASQPKESSKELKQDSTKQTKNQ